MENPGFRSLQGSMLPVKVSAPPSVRALAALKSARWRSILVGCCGVKMQRFPVMFMGFHGISGDFCGVSWGFVGFQVIFVGFHAISGDFCGISWDFS